GAAAPPLSRCCAPLLRRAVLGGLLGRRPLRGRGLGGLPRRPVEDRVPIVAIGLGDVLLSLTAAVVLGHRSGWRCATRLRRPAAGAGFRRRRRGGLIFSADHSFSRYFRVCWSTADAS